MMTTLFTKVSPSNIPSTVTAIEPECVEEKLPDIGIMPQQYCYDDDPYRLEENRDPGCDKGLCCNTEIMSMMPESPSQDKLPAPDVPTTIDDTKELTEAEEKNKERNATRNAKARERRRNNKRVLEENSNQGGSNVKISKRS